MRIILTFTAIFIVLVLNEVWWRKGKTHGELSRKFVHITVGSFVAFWPFFLSWKEIELMSLALAAVIVLSKTLHIFTAIHSVQRPTWGEMCFALAVGASALITHNKWIYMAALMQMGLADGLAAMIGMRFGRSTSYSILGHTKSIIGTLTFFATSVIILLGYVYLSGDHIAGFFLLLVALIASLLENLSMNGLDNLMVPLVVAAMLANH